MIQALEKSAVEKIFIVQDEDSDLQKVLTPSSKAIFITKDKQHASVATGTLFAIEKVAEYYGRSDLGQKTIMIVPCDAPLVTPQNINALVNKTANTSADVIITIIASERLNLRFPQKHFRGVYLSDEKAYYTMQNVLFVAGDFIQYDPLINTGNLKITFRNWRDGTFNSLVESLDSIERSRNKPIFLEKLFIGWLFNKVYAYYVIRLLIDMVFRHVTMARLIKYLNGADQMQAGYIISEEVEFSADIDTPEDYRLVTGVPWQNEI